MAITKKTCVTATITSLIAADATRQGIIFDNQSAADFYVAGTSDASAVTVASGTKPGLLIPAGRQVTFWATIFEKNEWFGLLTGAPWYGIQASGSDAVIVIHTF